MQLTQTTNSEGGLEDWHLWCRLCAKRDPQGNIDVLFKDKEQQQSVPDGDLSIVAAIKNFFCVDICLDNNLPRTLCTECFSLVTSLLKFSERVSQMQRIFEDLQSSTKLLELDLHAQPLKHVLLDEHNEHLLGDETVTEVGYIESMTNNELEEQVFEADVESSNLKSRSIPSEEWHIIETEDEIRVGNDVSYDDDPFGVKMEEIEIGSVQITEYETNNKHEHQNIHETVAVNTNIETDHLPAEIEPIKKDRKHRKTELEHLLKDGQPVTSGRKSKQSSENISKANQTQIDDVSKVEMQLTQKGRKHKKSELDRLQEDRQQEQDKNSRKSKKFSENVSKGEMEPTKRGRKFWEIANHLQKDRQQGQKDRKSKKCSDNILKTKQVQLDDVQKDSDGNFQCSKCPQKFRFIQYYRAHLQKKHSLKTKIELKNLKAQQLLSELGRTIPCIHCQQTFCSNTLMQQHVTRVHMTNRPYVCKECGMEVRTKNALTDHMWSHTDERPIECKLCKKKFKNKYRLKRHTQIHDPTKYKCPDCDQELNTRATLKWHRLVHSDERRFKCDYCGRVFKRVEALKNHLLLHTGLKPYLCEFCERTFTCSSTYSSHKRKVHHKEMAALAASGGVKTQNYRLPKLEALKEVVSSYVHSARKANDHASKTRNSKKTKASKLNDHYNNKAKKTKR